MTLPVTGRLAAARPPWYAAPLAACDQVAVAPVPPGWRVTGRTRIRGDGPYLAAHFPGLTIFPGVFVLEAVVQAVGQALGDRAGRPLRLAELGSLRLRTPLFPGDWLCLRAEVVPESDRSVVVRAGCRRDDGVPAAGLTLRCRWSR